MPGVESRRRGSFVRGVWPSARPDVNVGSAGRARAVGDSAARSRCRVRPRAHGRMSAADASERSHRGLVQRFAKPPCGVTSIEGSNPSLSARSSGQSIGIECARSSADRALGCGPKGRGFESRRARHLPPYRRDPPLPAPTG